MNSCFWCPAVLGQRYSSEISCTNPTVKMSVSVICLCRELQVTHSGTASHIPAAFTGSKSGIWSSSKLGAKSYLSGRALRVPKLRAGLSGAAAQQKARESSQPPLVFGLSMMTKACHGASWYFPSPQGKQITNQDAGGQGKEWGVRGRKTLRRLG